MELKKSRIEISETRAEQAKDKTVPAISERKLAANRESAKKSTGPRTPEGKAKSRFNALTHGLLATQVMFSPDGKLLDERLYELLEGLRDKYGRDDVRTELLVEGIVTDHWRSRQGLQYEAAFLKNGNLHFSSFGCMSNLQRYNTASRRAILKNLELLDQLQPTPSAIRERDDDLGDPQMQLEPEVQALRICPETTDGLGSTARQSEQQPPTEIPQQVTVQEGPSDSSEAQGQTEKLA
jgi:hypothetical protein